MKLRQYSWMARAAHEQAFAKRTWFVTLTYGPNRRRAIMAMASEARERNCPPSRRLITASGGYVAKFMKTIRKRGFEVRYIFCPELHRDGFPHWHGLIHDTRGDLKWADISSAWSAGFSVVKLVKDANALRYVTKYLSKEKHGRVRASLNYGAPVPEGEQAPGSDPADVVEHNGAG